MKITFLSINDILCPEGMETHRKAMLTIGIELQLDDDELELFKEYCRIRSEEEETAYQTTKLTEEIARKHKGVWRATFKDGRIAVLKGFFRKKIKEVYDPELSPRLRELLEKERRLYRERKRVEEQILERLKKEIQKT